MSLKKEIEDKTWSVIETPLSSMGYELVDVEFGREGKKSFLRIYIDKEGGISLDDCVEVTKFLSPLLEVEEVEDMIPGSYNLEVSSPGLFRKLKREKDYNRAVGKRVKITTFAPVGKERTFIGTLIENGENEFVIEVNGEKYLIEKKNVANINLEPELKF